MIKNSSTRIYWLNKFTGLIPASIYRSLFRRDVISFCYHVISDRSLPYVNHLYAYKSAEMFEHDLVYLLENHTPISYEQFVAHHQGQAQLKSNSVMLSFDDGYRECFTVVRPLLLKYGVPCTFFITTDLIDNQKMFYRQKVSMCIEKVQVSKEPWKQSAFERLSRSFGRLIESERDFSEWIKSFKYADRASVDLACEILEVDITEYLKSEKPFLSLEELRILACDGFTIGAHSKSHPWLAQLPVEVVEQEIVESCQIIQEFTRAGSIPFAFPYNSYGLQRELLADIRSRNKVVGYFFGTNGINAHKGLIFDRIWADTPEQDGSDQSNLPGLLYLAYQDMWFAWLREYKHYRMPSL